MIWVNAFAVAFLAYNAAMLVFLALYEPEFRAFMHCGFQSLIYKIGARLRPRRFQKAEIQLVATHPKFLELIKRLIVRFGINDELEGSELRSQLHQNIKHLLGSEDLMLSEELINSFDAVCKSFANIIRNRLHEDVFVNTYFYYLPNYILMRLDPLWEQIVKTALLQLPFISPSIKEFAQEQGPQGTADRNKGSKNSRIHSSRTLLRDWCGCDKSILSLKEGFFNHGGEA